MKKSVTLEESIKKLQRGFVGFAKYWQEVLKNKGANQ